MQIRNNRKLCFISSWFLSLWALALIWRIAVICRTGCSRHLIRCWKQREKKREMVKESIIIQKPLARFLGFGCWDDKAGIISQSAINRIRVASCPSVRASCAQRPCFSIWTLWNVHVYRCLQAGTGLLRQSPAKLSLLYTTLRLQ